MIENIYIYVRVPTCDVIVQKLCPAVLLYIAVGDYAPFMSFEKNKENRNETIERVYKKIKSWKSYYNTVTQRKRSCVNRHIIDIRDRLKIRNTYRMRSAMKDCFTCKIRMKKRSIKRDASARKKGKSRWKV